MARDVEGGVTGWDMGDSRILVGSAIGAATDEVAQGEAANRPGVVPIEGDVAKGFETGRVIFAEEGLVDTEIAVLDDFGAINAEFDARAGGRVGMVGSGGVSGAGGVGAGGIDGTGVILVKVHVYTSFIIE